MLSNNQPETLRINFFSNRYRNEVFYSIIGMSVFLLLLIGGLYSIWRGGSALVALPWFNLLGFTFLTLASVSLAILALGRYQVLHDRFSYWIGIGFATSSIGLIFYILSWPGLLSDGQSFIAQSPNTSGFLVTLFTTILAIFMLVALRAYGSHDADPQSHRLITVPILAWCSIFVLLYSLLVIFEQYLPSMVREDGSYSPVLLVWDAVTVLLFMTSSVVAVRQYRRYGDPFSAYIVFPQIALVYAIFVTLIGQGRYDIWWYSARVVLMIGYSMVLIGMLSESVRYVREITNSEIRSRYLTNSLPQLIWTCTPVGLFNDLSNQWLAYTGISKEQQLGSLWVDWIHPEDRPRIIECWRAALAAGEKLDTEARIQSSEGSFHWFKVVVLPIQDSSLQIVEWFGSCTDVEDLKQSEAALKESERYQRELARELEVDRGRLAAILDNLPVGIWVADLNGRLIKKNVQADRVWAGDAPLLDGMEQYTEYEAWFADDGKKLSPEDYPVSKTLRTGQPFEPVELKIRRLDGSEGFVLVSAAPIYDSRRQITGVVSINLDITERKQSEEDRLKKEIQIQINRRLFENEEKERQQLARDLHDEPLQELLAMNMEFASIIESADENWRAQLKTLQIKLLETITQVRDISFYLRPPVLIHMGIGKALRGYITVFQEQHPGLQVNLKSEGYDVPLPETMSLAIYRIMQELLRNAQKHSKANQVNIALNITRDDLLLEVQDNGVGFDPPEEIFDYVHAGHYGIVGIRERLETFNGSIKISSSPDSGTRVSIALPIHHKEHR